MNDIPAYILINEGVVPVGCVYLYQHRVGEMGENAKRENGDYRNFSIEFLKVLILIYLIS